MGEVTGPDPTAWHWDRYVSATRLVWRGDDCSHLPPELFYEATWCAKKLKAAGLNPFKHLRLCGEEGALK